MTERDDGRGEVSFKDSQTIEYKAEGIEFELEIDCLEMFLLSEGEGAFLMGSVTAFADLTAGVIKNRGALVQAGVSANQYLLAIETVLERANTHLLPFFGADCRTTLEEGQIRREGQDRVVYESPNVSFEMELAGLGSLPPDELFTVMNSAKSFAHIAAGAVANKERLRGGESLIIPNRTLFNEIDYARLAFERVYEEVGINLN